MPQHLKIEVEGKLVGWISTSNKGGTIYDVSLRVPEIGSNFSLPNVDTGVQRQPQDSQAGAEDSRNDFAHARRCIAGAVASSNYFLKKIRKHGSLIYTELKPLIMRLMTNLYDRGCIKVHPIDNESVNVVVTIGVGANRVPNSSPKDKFELTYEGIDVSGTFTQTERAFRVLLSIGPDLLRSLADQASN